LIHLQWKFKLLVAKFTWGNKAKNCWVMSTNFCFQKFVDNAQQCFAFTTFLPIILIFIECDGIQSRLSFLLYATSERHIKRKNSFFKLSFLTFPFTFQLAICGIIRITDCMWYCFTEKRIRLFHQVECDIGGYNIGSTNTSGLIILWQIGYCSIKHCQI
jgi:hypothetical protein